MSVIAEHDEFLPSPPSHPRHCMQQPNDGVTPFVYGVGGVRPLEGGAGGRVTASVYGTGTAAPGGFGGGGSNYWNAGGGGGKAAASLRLVPHSTDMSVAMGGRRWLHRWYIWRQVGCTLRSYGCLATLPHLCTCTHPLPLLPHTRTHTRQAPRAAVAPQSLATALPSAVVLAAPTMGLAGRASQVSVSTCSQLLVRAATP